MVETEYKIVVKKLDQLERLLKGMNAVNVAREKMDQMPVTLGKVNSGIKAVNKSISETPKVMKVMESATNKAQARLDAFQDADKLGLLNRTLKRVTTGIENMAKKKKALDTLGGRAGVFGQQILNLGANMKTLEGKSNGFGKILNVFGGAMKSAGLKGKGMFMALKGGFGAVVKGVSAGSLSIGASLAGIGATVAAVLGPIAIAIGVIAAAAFTFKKMWDANIGGVQTKFMKLAGQLKTAWGKFNAAFVRGLQALSPVFDAVLTPIFDGITIIGHILFGVFKAVGAAIKPVIAMFASLAGEFSSIFGAGKKDGEAMKKVIAGIGKTFEVVGKILAVTTKVALAPIFVLLKVQIKIYKAVMWVVKAFARMKLVQTWLKQVTVTLKVWKFIFTVIGKIIKFIGGLIWKHITSQVKKSIEFYKMLWGVIKDTKAFQQMLRVANAIKNVFISIKTIITDSIKWVWDQIMKVVNLIPSRFLPEGFKEIKTTGSPAAKAEAGAGTTNNSTTNNNQQIVFNTSRPTTPDMAGGFVNAFAKQLVTK